MQAVNSCKDNTLKAWLNSLYRSDALLHDGTVDHQLCSGPPLFFLSHIDSSLGCINRKSRSFYLVDVERRRPLDQVVHHQPIIREQS